MWLAVHSEIGNESTIISSRVQDMKNLSNKTLSIIRPIHELSQTLNSHKRVKYKREREEKLHERDRIDPNI